MCQHSTGTHDVGKKKLKLGVRKVSPLGFQPSWEFLSEALNVKKGASKTCSQRVQDF